MVANQKQLLCIMPLYIDYHQFDRVTIEDVKEAHIADRSVQDQYGVKYHQFWVNEKAGTVFCLMEGPDMETCAMVHRLAHGNVACAMTEVKEGIYKLALGHSVRSDGGVVRYPSGEVDAGYRNMLVVSIRGITWAKDSADITQLLLPDWARNKVLKTIDRSNGRQIPWELDDSLIAVFDNASLAVQCAVSIQKGLLKDQDSVPKVIFKIGLATGQPVTRSGDFFNETIKLAHRLSNAAAENQILTTVLTTKLVGTATDMDAAHLRIVSPMEEQLLSDLFNTVERDFSDDMLRIENLSRNMGVSRPQLYRKIKSITGRSPSNFVKDLRLNRAKTLLRQKSGNVSEVAFEVGYSNLSHFSKSFANKFGFNPSAL